jgi:acid ceramidase
MTDIKTYILDLDIEPSKRWINIISENKNQCIEAIAELQNKILSQINPMTYNILYYTINYVTPSKYIKYYDELKSISEILEISFDKILIGQLCYEMFAACTSVGICMNGQNVHYRTMDWPMKSLKNITIKLKVMKSNKILYEGITWIGYVGILTGMKYNSYSLSINYRKSNNTLHNNALKIIQLKYPISYLCRELLESSDTLLKVKEKLEQTELISPCYISLCGINNDFYVITRDPDSYKTIFANNYLIQTNKDSENDKYDIFNSTERHKYVEELILKNDKNLINNLVKYPIINLDTIYYCVMIPSKNKFICKIIE